MEWRKKANDDDLHALMKRTGYPLIQENGQRKFGPPPFWEGPPPPKGCEIFVGKMPRDIYEDELIPVFERIAPIYQFRLMMDFSGSNRGYAFCMYTNQADAERAVRELNDSEVRKGRRIGVCMSLNNCKISLAGLPATTSREDVFQQLRAVTPGLVDVTLCPDNRNIGVRVVVEYDNHTAAAKARRLMAPDTFLLLGRSVLVEWVQHPQKAGVNDLSEKMLQQLRLEKTPSTTRAREHRSVMPCTATSTGRSVQQLRQGTFPSIDITSSGHEGQKTKENIPKTDHQRSITNSNIDSSSLKTGFYGRPILGSQVSSIKSIHTPAAPKSAVGVPQGYASCSTVPTWPLNTRPSCLPGASAVGVFPNGPFIQHVLNNPFGYASQYLNPKCSGSGPTEFVSESQCAQSLQSLQSAVKARPDCTYSGSDVFSSMLRTMTPICIPSASPLESFQIQTDSFPLHTITNTFGNGSCSILKLPGPKPSGNMSSPAPLIHQQPLMPMSSALSPFGHGYLLPQ